MRLVVLTALVSVACGASSIRDHTAQQPRATAAVSASTEQDAMDLAAAYLLRHLDRSGRFDYLRRSRARDSKYNVLRHAGAIYSLAQYYQYKPSPTLRDAILRASRYLKQQYLRAPEGKPELLAIFSQQSEEGGKPGTAKLGGAGLGLIALSHAHRLDPSIVSRDELRALGRFVAFMQRDDGSFHSKYIEGLGYDPSFQSLYYPGEAMLGLTMLFDIDSDPQWLQIALRSAAQLVASRQEVEDWPADHWMMLASVPLLERYQAIPSPPISSENLAQHMEALGERIMAKQELDPPIDRRSEAGSFSRAGSGTPTATRLEGLTALLQNQRSRGQAADPTLERSIRAGLGFLMRCQIMDDSPEYGGMPHSCAADAGEDKRDREVRIDYVQHYLSAMLAARTLGLLESE